MKKTETITRAINFRQVGQVLEHSRCFYTWPNDRLGTLEMSPTNDPHLWRIQEAAVEQTFDRSITRTKFSCSRCGEIVYEERPTREDDGKLDYQPETVIPWDAQA